MNSIILIPGLGTPPVETWPFCSTSSLQSFLPTAIKRARLLAFDYTIPLADNFSWENFLLQGEHLLRALSEAQHDGDSNQVYAPSSFVVTDVLTVSYRADIAHCSAYVTVWEVPS